MHQPPPAAEPVETMATGRAKQPWEPPVLDVLPLSETLNQVGPGTDGMISSSS